MPPSHAKIEIYNDPLVFADLDQVAINVSEALGFVSPSLLVLVVSHTFWYQRLRKRIRRLSRT